MRKRDWLSISTDVNFFPVLILILQSVHVCVFVCVHVKSRLIPNGARARAVILLHRE